MLIHYDFSLEKIKCDFQLLNAFFWIYLIINFLIYGSKKFLKSKVLEINWKPCLIGFLRRSNTSKPLLRNGGKKLWTTKCQRISSKLVIRIRSIFNKLRSKSLNYWIQWELTTESSDRSFNKIVEFYFGWNQQRVPHNE